MLKKGKNQLYEKIENKISSGIMGLLAGMFIGWYLSGIIKNVLIIDVLILTIAMIVLFGGLGILLDLKNPILAETIVFALAIIVFIQSFWDFGAQDWNIWRTIMFFGSLGLFILNIFTGYLRIGTAKRIIRQQLGLRS